VRRLAVPVVWGACLLGAAGTVVALGGRGSAGVFRDEQSRSLVLTPSTVLTAAAVQAVVAQAPEPVSPSRRTPPAQVSCRAQGGGTLRNPWSCTIRYRSGTRAHYRVVVQPDGHYTGTGTGIINGCCVKAPTLE
jgi:hypothetical protein